MKLTIEHDRETIKRYGHIRPVRGWGARRCDARCPGTSRTCTLETGHRGPHVAHGLFKRVVAVWDTPGTEVVASSDRLRTTLVPRTQSPLRGGNPQGIMKALWHRVVRAADSLEEISWVVLFIAIVGWAIYWVHLLFTVSR
jgi:hypothetical protein